MMAQSELKKHAELFDKMADVLGVDLEKAIEDTGALNLIELGDAVLRCAGCSDPSHCAGWLNAHENGAEKAPGYCQNIELFERLK